MCLGALVDAGCPLEAIKSTLQGLSLPGFDLQAEKVRRGPLSGTQVHVRVEEERHRHRKLADVLALVDRVNWPGPVRERIEAAFTALAKAEGRIHGKAYDQIHFHEVGSFDAVIDISGSLLGLHLLGVEQCACSKIHVGEGFVETQHGVLPVPAPATAELLQGFDLYSRGLAGETVTPTGAALLRVLAGQSSPMPPMRLQAIGYGAGTRETKELPNLLRVFVGETPNPTVDAVTVIEANIDDMNPEFYEPLLEQLFSAGALDITLSPLMMKKSRPGTLLTVIASPPNKESLAQMILRESATIGVRMWDCERRILQRESGETNTPWGPVKGKVCWGAGIEKRFTPEYEDCRRIQREHQVPIQRVYEEAVRSYYSQK